MWIILTIILALNSIWLLKLNKDLANRNEYLMQVDELKKTWQDEMDKDTDNKED
jgi:predicted Holliday junction resolvase-like endonuclease